LRKLIGWCDAAFLCHTLHFTASHLRADAEVLGGYLRRKFADFCEDSYEKMAKLRRRYFIFSASRRGSYAVRFETNQQSQVGTPHFVHPQISFYD
jgi:hypothetical protein